MTSTKKDRLLEIYEAYNIAFQNRPRDLQDATTTTQASAILKNVETLESHYLKAARQALDASGPAVEAAYQAARQAREEVEQAYEGAVKLSQRINSVSKVVKAVGSLVAKASGS